MKLFEAGDQEDGGKGEGEGDEGKGEGEEKGFSCFGGKFEGKFQAGEGEGWEDELRGKEGGVKDGVER